MTSKQNRRHSVKWWRGRFVFVLLVLVVFGVGACSGTRKANYEERPVEQLYNDGLGLLEDGQYSAAIEKFDEADRQHPYSIWATRAQLMSAYAYYKANRYIDAVMGLDRFAELHPSHKDVPYAIYLKGLSYYEQISDVSRDQKFTEWSLSTFRELIARFPDSRYASDAKLKIDLAYDHLAGKQMEIGRFYHTQHQYLAAINRFRDVVDKYQTTTHVPEALHRLTEAYLALGIVDEARKTAAVLGYNFPGSEWYLDSYEFIEGKKVRVETPDGRSWWRVWN